MTHTFLIELTDEVKGFEDSVDYFERVYGAEEFDLAEHDKQIMADKEEIYNEGLITMAAQMCKLESVYPDELSDICRENECRNCKYSIPGMDCYRIFLAEKAFEELTGGQNAKNKIDAVSVLRSRAGA